MKPKEIIPAIQDELLVTLKEIQRQLQVDQSLKDQTIDLSDENRYALQVLKSKYDFLTRVVRKYEFKTHEINQK